MTQPPIASFAGSSSTVSTDPDPLKAIEQQLASEERSLFLRLQQIRQLQSEHQFPHTCTPSEVKADDYSEASKIYKDLGELPPLRVISQQQIDPIGYQATTEAAAAAAAAEAKAKAPNSRNAACAACYRSKVACDKGRPCSRCVRSGKECVTRPPVKLGRPRRKRPESEEESPSSGSGSTSEESDPYPKKRRATGTRSRPQKKKRKAR